MAQFNKEYEISIQDYLDGKMNAVSEKDFEQELQKNPDLMELYCFEVDIRASLIRMEIEKYYPEINQDNVIVAKQVNLSDEPVEQSAIRALNEKSEPIDDMAVVESKKTEPRPVSNAREIHFGRITQITAAASILFVAGLFRITEQNRNEHIVINANPRDTTSISVKTNKSTNTPLDNDTINYAGIYNDFFELDAVPNTKPFGLAYEMDDFADRKFKSIQQFNADNPPTLMGETNGDKLNSRQNLMELGHYYKGLAYMATNDQTQAHKNLQWVIEYAQDKKLVIKAQWYLALQFIKQSDSSSAVSILSKLEENKRAFPYNIKAKKLKENLQK